jgi:serine protease Do
MSRLTAFSLSAVLLGAAPISTVVYGAEASSVDQSSLAETIQASVDKVFRDNLRSVVRVESEDDLGKVAGTGFFADASGTIYTLSSVVGDGLSLTVAYNGRRLPARVLTKDNRSGIALIKVDLDESTPFPAWGDCLKLKTAAPLVVVGFPYDHEVSPSFGLIGGFDRKSKGAFFTTTHIRANIPVQRGQGGSPVLDINGKVVGVLVSGFEQGAGCYVLPIRAAEKVRTDYARYGDVRHGWAGVTVQEIPAAVEGSRMAVDVVDPTGPAASSFRPGDVILQVGDIAVREPEDALDASFFLTAGEPVDVRIVRNGEVLTVPFTPAEHPLGRKTELQALGPGSLLEP